jgi:MinD-like ATPase involved in chromosome partitioning or flagellar assembly
MPKKLGRFITFYSYKGGTGRTMALSNVAWILASNGYDVLVIDWDLEAPGMHRYLRPFLIDPELASTPGLIDFLWDAAEVSMTPPNTENSAEIDFPSLDDYVVGLDWHFGDERLRDAQGSISFIPAGRQDENYAQRVNTFDWDNFYERLGGGQLLHAEREALREKYDYVLIDSRTGVSDTSSVCTVQMPDLLVVFFTLNRQSIKGAAAVAASVFDQRGDAFRIFPVPTRVEDAESEKKKTAIRYARRVFAPLLMHVQSNRSRIVPEEQVQYWNDVETPYKTVYAFEEVPAAFKEEAGSRSGLLAANERIAEWITDRTVKALQPVSEVRRDAVVAQYAFTEGEEGIGGWVPPPDNLSWIRILWDRVRWRVRRRPAQYAAIAIACAAVVLTATVVFLQADEMRAARRIVLETKADRVEAEKIRLEAEKLRLDAERNTETTRRIIATSQQEAELARQAAAAAQQQADDARKLVADTRKQADDARQDADRLRADIESGRQQAEEARKQAEVARQQAEDARRDGDRLRADAQAARQQADDARKQADAARQEVVSIREAHDADARQSDRWRLLAETATSQRDVAIKEATEANQALARSKNLRAAAEGLGRDMLMVLRDLEVHAAKNPRDVFTRQLLSRMQDFQRALDKF